MVHVITWLTCVESGCDVFFGDKLSIHFPLVCVCVCLKLVASVDSSVIVMTGQPTPPKKNTAKEIRLYDQGLLTTSFPQ